MFPSNFLSIMHILPQSFNDLQNTTVFIVLHLFSSSSFAKTSQSLRNPGQGSVISLIFGLSGGKPTITRSCIASRFFTLARVSLVAVAVSAIIGILVGSKLRMPPKSAKQI